MNYIIIAVVTIVIFIMIFVAFASDDREDEIGYLADDEGDKEEKKAIEEKAEVVSEPETVEPASLPVNYEQVKIEENQNTAVSPDEDNNMFQQLSDEEEKQQSLKAAPAEITRIHPINLNKTQEPVAPILEVGSEDDLRLRLILKQNIAKPIFQEKSKCSYFFPGK